MKKLAKAKLADEISKLTPWQLAVTDEHGPLGVLIEGLDREKPKMASVLQLLTEGAEKLFEYWDVLNEDAREGRVPDEQTVANIKRAHLLMGGSPNSGKFGREQEGVGKDGYYARSATQSSKLLIDVLKEWVQIKADINGGVVQVNPLTESKVEKWLEEIFETIQEVVEHGAFDEIEKPVQEIGKMLADFQAKADKFFQEVPEGKEVMVDLKDQKSRNDFARRLLGVSPDGNNQMITPAKAMSDLRNDSRKAVKNALDYFATVLRVYQMMASVLNEFSSLAMHWSKVLYAVTSEAIQDFKDSNQDVPADLQEAHDALKKIK